MLDYVKEFYEGHMDDVEGWGLERIPWNELSPELQRIWAEMAAAQARKETQDALER